MLGSRTPRAARSFVPRHKTRQAQDLRECARMLGISPDEFRNALLALGAREEASLSARKARAQK
jgi:hypothetical protein